MAYTNKEQQRIFASASAIIQGTGGRMSRAEILDRLSDEHVAQTPQERRKIAEIMDAAQESVRLAERIRDNPAYRPRQTTYQYLPFEDKRKNNFEYWVVVDRGGGAGRGLFKVQNDKPMSGAEASQAAIAMARALAAGDPYFARFSNLPNAQAVTASVVTAFTRIAPVIPE